MRSAVGSKSPAIARRVSHETRQGGVYSRMLPQLTSQLVAMLQVSFNILKDPRRRAGLPGHGDGRLMRVPTSWCVGGRSEADLRGRDDPVTGVVDVGRQPGVVCRPLGAVAHGATSHPLPADALVRELQSLLYNFCYSRAFDGLLPPELARRAGAEPAEEAVRVAPPAGLATAALFNPAGVAGELKPPIVGGLADPSGAGNRRDDAGPPAVPPGPAVIAAERLPSSPEFLASLSRSNRGQDRWDPGWTVYLAMPTRQIYVQKRDRQRERCPANTRSPTPPA